MLEGWTIKKLDDIGECRIGLTYSPDDVCDSGGTLVLRSSNIQKGRITYDDNVRVVGEVPKKALVKTGDILICVRNGSRSLIGKSAIISPADADNAFGAFMAILRTDHSEFVFQLFQTDDFKRQVHRTLGATINQITNADLRSFSFLFPPVPKQRKIAELLRTWDKAIEKLTALRAVNARRLDGIAQRLLVPSRAIGRDVPQSNWSLSSFGEVFEERKDKNAGLGASDVITVGKYAIRKQSEHFTRSVASKDLSNYWIISPGDFVYDPMSAYYGAIGRFSGSADGILSPAYRVIRLSPDVDPEFMVALLRTHHIRFLLETRSSQGNKEGKRRLLQRDEFESIEFKLPSIETQREIAAKIAVFRAELDLTDREIKALTRQKRGLMQKLLTGEWRVEVED